MKFQWSFWGNKPVKKLFQNIILNKKPASSYLLLGPSHLGKTVAGKEFAQALNCQNTNLKPCGSCFACLEIKREEGSDVVFLLGEESIKIDDIREIKRRLCLKVSSLPFKIAFLKDVERMTEEAGNALLKILEEPPQKTIFVLTSSAPFLVLPTIISRCQIIKIQPVPFVEIEKKFLEKTNDLSLSQYLASVSAGRPGVGIALLENPEILQKNIEILKKFLEIKDKNNFEKLKFIEEIFSSKIPLEDVLDFWLYFIRDILLAKNSNLSLISNTNLKEIILHSKDKYNFSHIRFFIDLILKTKKLLEKNVKPKLALEVLVLEI